MNILAMDTSAAQCAVALLSGDEIVARAVEPMARGQAERLMPLAEEVLSAAGMGWRDLDRLGVCTGPGNFTGTRISVAAVRGLALALGRPAVGVSRFDELAFGAQGPLAVILDARRDRAYVQVFGDEALAPRMVALGDLASLVPPDAAIITDLDATLFARQGRAPLPAPPPDPARIARIAAARAEDGITRPAPLYLRSADASLPAEPAPRILDDA